MSDQKQTYRRFSIAQRIEHWVQVLSFTVLALTGLPQKFVGFPWAESMIAFLGGIETVRVIHRYAALVLTIAVIYHGAVVVYKIVVQKLGWSMMPRWQDAKDLAATIAYNLGRRKEPPKMPRYNFEEKLEYWAFVWGTVIMVITGFMLWNPIAAAEFLPGSFIPAALAAHSGEALLAVLAIIVWHMYGVHIRKFNPSMFTGKLSRAEMEHEHALELEAIEKGTQPQPAPREDQIKRARIFVPLLIVIVATLSYGVYLFTTFEQTAITTVEAAELYKQEPYQPIDFAETLPHVTITEYKGPQDCATSGCHDPKYVDTAAASDHSKRLATVGPNPLLAKVATQDTPPADTTPNCLICHAKNFILHDPLASAQSVGPAGNSTCLRCHTTLEHQGEAHIEAGLGCVSCHTSTDHQIKTRVECTSCHLEQPHRDPFINSKHGRLDCRACHIQDGEQMIIDATQSARSDITGYFAPAMKTQPADAAAFAWQTKNGAIVSAPADNAKIVPLTSLVIEVPDGFDPVDFAHTGADTGAAVELTSQLVPSHYVIKESPDCADCHGPEAKFDFLSLGYDEETANKLSLKKTTSDE